MARKETVVMNGVPHMPDSVHILHEVTLHGIQCLSRGVGISAEQRIHKIGKHTDVGRCCQTATLAHFFVPV